MLMVVVLGIALMSLAAVSVQMSLFHSVAQEVQEDAFTARQLAESGAAQALARITEGGFTTPSSGQGAAGQWVPFSEGEFLYYTTFDAANNVSTVRSWGRIAADPSPSTSTAAPDSVLWNGRGWLVQGIEVFIKSVKYIPETPIYMGNGGIQKPRGGFSWASGVDPADPSTWVPVWGNPTSWQSNWVPFEASALSHPVDYLYNGGTPAPASSPHPYNIWASQNPIGQYNVEAWFKNSASGNDPTTKLTPPPTTPYYDTSDPTSLDYPYPIDPSIPDVQDFADDLWNTYSGDPSATKLWEGSHSGTYGDMSNPGITFVTGKLKVNSGRTFQGAGVLVIRDDYDPNVDTNNKPSINGYLDIYGTFKWTGLVIVTGWNSAMYVRPGGDATIVGALFGEDSVQSMGEISLDSATLMMKIQDNCRVLYSNGLFTTGGLVNQFLPLAKKEVVGSREI